MATAELTEKDKQLLVHFTKGPTYVEIGTKYGGSAEVIVNAFPDITVYGIDIDDTNLQFKHPHFHFHRVSSLEMARGWREPINTLFIDADHDQAGVDFWVWGRHVVPGGYVLFHDYAHHSPLVVEDCERIAKLKEWKLIRRPGTLVHDASSIFIIQYAPGH